MNDEQKRQNIQKGCAFLDQRDPEWRKRINLARLDMTNPYACLLGQGWGSFSRALVRFDLSDADAERLGFVIHGYGSEYPQNQQDFWQDVEETASLTPLWKDILHKDRTTS